MHNFCHFDEGEITLETRPVISYKSQGFFGIFAVLKLSDYDFDKTFARAVCWRYWKQLQRSERRRTANPYGFYIP